jgi:hypothetical protein
MEHFVNNILSNPLYIVIAVVILGVLAFGLFKKMVKVIIVALFLLAAYAAYVYYTGGNARDAVKTVIEEGRDAVKK